MRSLFSGARSRIDPLKSRQRIIWPAFETPSASSERLHSSLKQAITVFMPMPKTFDSQNLHIFPHHHTTSGAGTQTDGRHRLPNPCESRFGMLSAFSTYSIGERSGAASHRIRLGPLRKAATPVSLARSFTLEFPKPRIAYKLALSS